MKIKKLSAILLAGALMATPVVTTTAMAESSATESADSTQSIVDESGNLKIEGTKVTGTTSKGNEAKEIIIPEGVTEIGERAFSYCKSLNNVTIPKSVIKIGDSAFSSCTSLTNVTISEGVTEIGNSVFEFCTSLKSVTIPASVEKIGNFAFLSGENLESINVSENNKNFTSVDGVLFNKDKTELILYPFAKTNTSYTIPDGVKIIDDFAFAANDWATGYESKSKITEVIIPDSVTKIGYGAFSHTALSSVKIGEGVTEIGIGAFGSTSLTSVTIPKSVNKIDDRAFSDCTKLEEVKYTDGLKELGRDVFDNTPWLEKKSDENPLVIVNGILINASKCKGDVVIPSNVTAIQQNVFKANENITSVVIPEGVTKIDSDTFNGCTKLENITIPKSVDFIYAKAFEGTPWLENKIKEDPMVIVNDILIDGSALKGDVVIPNNVKMISYCFSNYYGEEKTITSLTFSKKVKTIFLGNFFPHETDIFFNGSQEQFDNIVVYAYPSKGGPIHEYDYYTHMTIETLGESKREDNEYYYADFSTFHFANPVNLTSENVVLDAEAGVLPEDAKLNVKPIADKTDSTKSTYEITITENDKEIQPDGEVTVKIPVPEAMKGKTVYVFRAEADGTYTNMNAKADGDYLVFTTDHFSEYVVTTDGTLADKPDDSTDSNTSDSDTSSDSNSETSSDSETTSSDSNTSDSGSNKEDNADTGFGGIAMTIGVAALAGAAVVAARKRK